MDEISTAQDKSYSRLVVYEDGEQTIDWGQGPTLAP